MQQAIPFVGYRYFTEHGLVGDPGMYYDYIVGANGLFIHAENRFINASVCVGEANIRGLQPMRTIFVLKNGRIPWDLYHLAMNVLMSDALRENYLAIMWKDGAYGLVRPPQVGDEGSCHYDRVTDTVMEIHSHALMSSFFSGIDTRDEQGMAVYGVVGHLEQLIPDIELRLGVYGYFDKLSLNEVFGDVPIKQ